MQSELVLNPLCPPSAPVNTLKKKKKICGACVLYTIIKPLLLCKVTQNCTQEHRGLCCMLNVAVFLFFLVKKLSNLICRYKHLLKFTKLIHSSVMPTEVLVVK